MARKRNKKGRFSAKGGKKKAHRRNPKRRAAVRGRKRDKRGHFLPKKHKRGSKKRRYAGSKKQKRSAKKHVGTAKKHKRHNRNRKFSMSKAHAGRARRQHAAQLHQLAVSIAAKRGYTLPEAMHVAKKLMGMLKVRAAKAPGRAAAAAKEAEMAANYTRRVDYSN
jgi:hypothetical protein